MSEGAPSIARRKFYVDPAVQFPMILSLILLVTAEGFFVGWGFSKAISVARQWERPEQALEFFEVLFGTIVPVVAFNFLVGTWISNKIAGPLLQMRRTMAEIARGNLEADARIRGGDFLQENVQELNRMTQTLRRIIYRDRGFAAEADSFLAQCREGAAKLPEGQRQEMLRLLDGAQSRLSIINEHFMKGKKEAP